MAGARQTSFLEPGWQVPEAAAAVDPVERPRLTRQCQAVLARLEQGPATNIELIPISTRFSARIHELRKCGYVIELDHVDRANGLTQYTLRGKR